MNHKTVKLAPGLYFVATPIGTARDITLRALDILANADVIAAEDTRSMRKLMDIHGIALGNRPLLAYHDHNGKTMRPRLLEQLGTGKSVAYASEAGTPMIADPGFDLAREAAGTSHLVTTAPGPSAALAALTLAGLPTDRFLFAGFLPNTKTARRSQLQALGDVPATLVFYESPKRLAAMLGDAAEVLGAERNAAYCRELTKKFEEVQRGTLAELVERTGSLTLKGEVVVLIDRAASGSVNQEDIVSALRRALQSMSVRDASETVAQAYGLPKRKIYQMALEFDKEEDR
ncbi:MAG: 16S rRNA (cytidine(1402)-2'-O)-methyltransferase [Marinovum sp.]|nr:16S rRNA (cytidine(1402)-2'-O)-methyltransferase [Marinovum sp.]